MKLFEFFKYKKAPVKDKEPSLVLSSGDNIIDNIQQEFISMATGNAERIVRAFNSKYDGAFDYSIRSLNVLDSLIEDFSDFADLSDEEIIDDFCAQAGSYILEVARRNYGGTYFWQDSLRQPLLKTGLPDFEISILTFEKVKNRIVNGDEDNIPYFFKGYSERVRKAAKGDEVIFV
ncbi:MAG: hypothetical protein K0S23_1381 [Fluviicola sp.]|jgi:hypothetical protein|uniref:hypothetical protein n=1 Tax=Fluviicola sp. TaxID=1917219 RepID=UPI00260F5662|nr:hypothetical protein [Fluviicola sp.]MDF3027074.1 hypothetical protein [Fluviicola sp.]